MITVIIRDEILTQELQRHLQFASGYLSGIVKLEHDQEYIAFQYTLSSTVRTIFNALV